MSGDTSRRWGQFDFGKEIQPDHATLSAQEGAFHVMQHRQGFGHCVHVPTGRQGQSSEFRQRGLQQRDPTMLGQA